jgi:hypothetical protein
MQLLQTDAAAGEVVQMSALTQPGPAFVTSFVTVLPLAGTQQSIACSKRPLLASSMEPADCLYS